MQFRYVIIGLLLAGLFVAGQWVLQQPGIPPVRLPAGQLPVTTESAAERESAAQTEALRERERNAARVEVVDDLPELNDSDDWVRSQLSDLLIPWLAETELVRTGAVVLENASRGELPRKYLKFLAPQGRFAVRESRGALVPSQASHERFDEFSATLQSLPPERAAQLFRALEPLLAEAVRELGGSAESPRELAYKALGLALATPRIDGRQALQQPKVFYTYVDEELEALLPLQKQLLRMGPENLHALRLWLEDFGVALSPSEYFSLEDSSDG